MDNIAETAHGRNRRPRCGEAVGSETWIWRPSAAASAALPACKTRTLSHSPSVQTANHRLPFARKRIPVSGLGEYPRSAEGTTNRPPGRRALGVGKAVVQRTIVRLVSTVLSNTCQIDYRAKSDFATFRARPGSLQCLAPNSPIDEQVSQGPMNWPRWSAASRTSR